MVSQEEFVSFHRIDREVFKILVMRLMREAGESMEIVGLWLWLERVGFSNMVNRILRLPCNSINEVAEEAVTWLNCINKRSSWSEMNMMSVVERVLGEARGVVGFLEENEEKAKEGVRRMVEEVCERALGDIDIVEESDESRSMFLTFSKGYPVGEGEVREYIRSRYGECIQGFYMHQPLHPNQQPLFARLVFHHPSTIHSILNGATRAKFTINGKHVCARKFVPKPL